MGNGQKEGERMKCYGMEMKVKTKVRYGKEWKSEMEAILPKSRHSDTQWKMYRNDNRRWAPQIDAVGDTKNAYWFGPLGSLVKCSVVYISHIYSTKLVLIELLIEHAFFAHPFIPNCGSPKCFFAIWCNLAHSICRTMLFFIRTVFFRTSQVTLDINTPCACFSANCIF